jgi:hypothetical protein
LTDAPLDIRGYFFDNNLSASLVRGMKAFGEDVVHLTEMFDRAATDESFIPELGAKGLILITQDSKIRKRKRQRELIKKHGVGAFLLVNKEGGGHNASRCAIIEQLVRHWTTIKRESRQRQRPFFVAVRRYGTKLTPLHLSL